MNKLNTYREGPDEDGHFGIYGGRYVAETLMPLILDVETAYNQAQNDPAFHAELNGYLKSYVGRPSALYFAQRMSEHFGGARIYFKREDLNHTGAHKVNNCMGQILLARRMKKNRIIAETGAGMHGVATAAGQCDAQTPGWGCTKSTRHGLRWSTSAAAWCRSLAPARCDGYAVRGRETRVPELRLDHVHRDALACELRGMGVPEDQRAAVERDR